jgi:hypothetical protein
MGQRYYYKLRKPLEQLCQEYGRQLPTRDQLSSQVQVCSFRKEEYSREFASNSGVFSDGMLEAISNWLGVEPHEFVALTLDEPDHIREGAIDTFMLGWEGILKSLEDHREFIVHESSYMKTEREVRRAVEEWQIELGFQLIHEKEGQFSSDQEKFLTVALKHLGVRAESEIPNRVVDWWRVNPRTCMSAYDLTHKRCGFSCLVPLRDNDYNAVRRKAFRPHTITDKQVRTESRNALLFAATDFSYRLDPAYRRASTRAVLGCAMAQLVQAIGQRSFNNLRLLGQSHSNLARRRFEAISFHDIGKSDLCELLVGNDCSKGPFEQCCLKAARLIDSPREGRIRRRAMKE